MQGATSGRSRETSTGFFTPEHGEDRGRIAPSDAEDLAAQVGADAVAAAEMTGEVLDRMAREAEAAGLYDVLGDPPPALR